MPSFTTKLFTLAASAALFAASGTQAAPLNGAALQTRQAFSGQGTFFEVGLGSCGNQSSDSEAVVAISAAVFDTFPGATGNPNANPVCGKQISATANGITQTVTVVDRCVACAAGDLDFSPSAFQVFASLDAGRIPITWNFL